MILTKVEVSKSLPECQWLYTCGVQYMCRRRGVGYVAGLGNGVCGSNKINKVIPRKGMRVCEN